MDADRLLIDGSNWNAHKLNLNDQSKERGSIAIEIDNRSADQLSGKLK